MKVLHLSDTPLSGSPLRINNLLNKHATDIESHHIVWTDTFGYRSYGYDLVGKNMSSDELRHWLDWADVIHYHNRWRRQEIFKFLGASPPLKPSVIQIHSPRFSEDFTDEVLSGIPIAVIAQYHPRQWEVEMRYMVPNVVDITDEMFTKRKHSRGLPIVSYAPSNATAKQWDDKGYNVTAPMLKRLAMFDRILYFQLIVNSPFDEVIKLKSQADVAIDEVVTGSYHLSGLEYLAFGIPCYANVDEQTASCMKRVTGSDIVPFLRSTGGTLRTDIVNLIRSGNYAEEGQNALKWMKAYWNPDVLCGHYVRMYTDLPRRPNVQCTVLSRSQDQS